jgi:ketosteroid isomerase-like protein
MSREDVEVVRQVYEAVARRDTRTILTLYDAGVELSFSRGTLADHIVGGPAVWRGHDGLRTMDRELRESFENFETRYEELIDAGEHVVSVSRYRGRGRRSGVEIDGPLQFGVWSVRGSKVTKVSWYPTRKEALEAVGLRE